jgi:uncharacterized CHY-type Zn-finger protein
MKRIVHGEEIYGEEFDQQTRCAHYHSELDIIAIKFTAATRGFRVSSVTLQWPTMHHRFGHVTSLMSPPCCAEHAVIS